MAVSEADRYHTFVTRTLSEVQEGLKLDNGQEGSCKNRVYNALKNRTTSEDGVSRNAAKTVIEGRFILGGDDASYLASGLAMLWSTVGTPVPSNGGQELSLAPAALYSPDAVNGIHRGLIAAMEKRNQEMRKDAPGALSNLMRALVPLLPFLNYKGVTKDFLTHGRLESVEERNRLFKFLVDAKQKLNADTNGSAHIPSSSLAFKIVNQATKAHETAMRKKDQAAAKELKQAMATHSREVFKHRASIANLRNKITRRKTALSKFEAEKKREIKNLNGAIAALTYENKRQTEEITNQRLQLKELHANFKAVDAALKNAYDLTEMTSKQAVVNSGSVAERVAALGERLKACLDQLNACEKASVRQSRKLAADAFTAAVREQKIVTKDKEITRLVTALKKCSEAAEQRVQKISDSMTKQGVEDDAKLKGALEELSASRTEIGDLRTLVQESVKEVNTLRQQLDAVDQSIKTKDEEIVALKNTLEEKEIKITEMRLRQADKEQGHTVQVKGMVAKIAELEASEDALQETVSAKTQQLTDAQDECDKCEAAKTKAQAELAECKRFNLEKRGDVESAMKAAAAAEEDIVELEAQVARLSKQQLPAADADAAAQVDLKAALENAKAEVEASKRKLGACEQEKAALAAEETQLRANLVACNKTLDDAEVTCKANMAELQAKTQELQNEAVLLVELRKWYQKRDQYFGLILELQGKQGNAHINLVADGVTNNPNVADQLTATSSKLAEAEQMIQSIGTHLENLGIHVLGQNPYEPLDGVFTADPPSTDDSNLDGESYSLMVELATWHQKRDQNFERILELQEELKNTQITIDGFPPTNDPNVEAQLKETQRELGVAGTRIQRIEAQLKELGINPYEPVDDTFTDGSDDGYATATDIVTDSDGDGTATHMASSGDAWIATAVFRGLVGQRGPTEPADVAHCPQDALLPYALPDVKKVVKHLLPAHLLLQSTPDPTAADLERAMAACAACEHADKRQRCATDVTSPATTSEALALFEDDFAITGEVPAAELSAERHGVEMPHEVRWMPQGPRARTMARVAVMEHAVARCAQLAAKADVHPDVAAALRHAGAALKLQQLAPLYELYAAVENCDDPHPLGTGGRRLVTRPCAVVRGTLSFPVDAGVVPLTEAHVANAYDKPLTQDASLAQAMGKTAMQTAALRNDLRKRGLEHNVYVAPAAHELAFRSAPTGVNDGKQKGTSAGQYDPKINKAVAEARAEGGKAAGKGAAVTEAISEDAKQLPVPGDDKTNNRAPVDLYRDDTFVRIINRLIVAAAAFKLEDDGNKDDPPDPVEAFLEASNPAKTGEGLVTPQTRREGLWTEMHRNVAISQDRLWIFVRLMSGKIGGNVSEVITLADEATLKAAKAIQEQRLEVSKRVSDMQAKIVETVVASMLKNSRMTMEYVEKGADKNLAVIDAEARKDLKDLETGVSGRPFFEANVALKNLTIPNGAPPKLKEVLSGLADVGVQMQSTLEQTLAEPGAASASLIELSHPSNSYFVSMRPDAVAAIREAQEKLNCELGALGSSRRLMLWELVEGGCSVLVQRFAELCGYLLVQARTSTGVSAMYVSHQSIYTNASQTRVSLARLTAAACAYTARVAVPEFYGDDPETARFATLTQGEKVRDIDITARRVPVPTASLHAPISSDGWVNVGGRRKS